MKAVMIVAICVAVSAGAVATVHGAASPDKQAQWPANAGGGGTIQWPAPYRTRYEFLGTWVVAGEGPPAKELHVVYASPGVIEEFPHGKTFAVGARVVKKAF